MNIRTPPASVRTAVFPALLLAALAAAGCAAEKSRLLQEDWVAVSLGGAPVGYVHTLTRRVTHPEPAVVTSVFSQTRLRRLGVELAVRTAIEYREAPDGSLRTAESRTSASTYEVVCKARVVDDKMLITTDTVGTTHTSELTWDPEIIGPWAQTCLIRETGLAPGATVTFKAFIPEFKKIVNSTLKIARREKITIEGEEFELWRGTLDQSILPGLVSQVWLDDEANIVRSVTHIMGRMEMVRVTKEKALQKIAPEALADVMMRFFISSNRVIRNPQKVREALYRIEGDLDDTAGLMLEDRRQTIERRTPRGLMLRVRALGNPPGPAGAPPGPEFLSSSPYIQANDPLIVRLAEKAVGDAATPAEKAARLTKWVYENIRKKNLTVGFASAKEVALSRRGDCSEHGVLLAALLRAAGVPSRVVVGLVYWQGQFGYHMWTEAFLNDWTALDATLGSGIVDATHIKLTHTALDTPSASQPFLALVRINGKIKLTVEDVQE